MEFIKKIQSDMYAAMKSGDQVATDTLRMLLSKLKEQKINSKNDITESECISIIKKLVKQRKESVEMYDKANRMELADKEQTELLILNEYLPKMMSYEETKTLVQTILKETKVKRISEIGKVMPLIMQQGGQEVDGKTANMLLRELLD
tara:strand:+ start:2580 stop:3023 length:444 start_codon:yes stop_codon:yes gene_type:complete